MSARTYAEALFASTRRAGRARQVWAKVRGQSRRLLDLNTVASTCVSGDRRAAGTQTVPIGQIRGSEGRCEDFDVAFHPLKAHTEDRWLSVARANEYDRGCHRLSGSRLAQCISSATGTIASRSPLH